MTRKRARVISPRDAVNLDDEARNRFLALCHNIPVPDGMREEVVERLVLAAKVAERTGGRVGPRGCATVWPEYSNEPTEAPDDDEDDAPPERFSATAEQVAQADEAMMWAMRFVPDDRERQALAWWLQCKARRRKWSKLLRALGIASGTARHRVDRAIYSITVGLVRAGVVLKADD